MTIEQIYTKYICSNCINPNDEECEIKRRYNNTVFCKGYKNKTPKKRGREKKC